LQSILPLSRTRTDRNSPRCQLGSASHTLKGDLPSFPPHLWKHARLSASMPWAAVVFEREMTSPLEELSVFGLMHSFLFFASPSPFESRLFAAVTLTLFPGSQPVLHPKLLRIAAPLDGTLVLINPFHDGLMLSSLGPSLVTFPDMPFVNVYFTHRAVSPPSGT